MSVIPEYLRWGLQGVYLQNKARAELEKSQWIPKAESQAVQLQRLRALIKHAYESVPYYYKIFKGMKISPEDIRSPQDFSKLPVLKKEDVRSHAHEMISSKYGLTNLVEKKTSGSTSIPLKVYNCKEQNAYLIATKFRILSWMNMRKGDKLAYIGPPSLDKYPMEVIEPLRVYSYDLKFEKLEKLIENIRKFRPKLLHGFPSGINLLAKLCEERGISDIAFQSVLKGGEKMFDDEKKRMEKVFHSKVHDYYAASDAGIIGYDCSNHTGLHICNEYMFVEFLKDGEPADEGEMASVVLTPLFSYGMPRIRYEMGDIAQRIDDPCPCGRGLPLMGYVDGRKVDVLTTPDGRLMCESTFQSRIFQYTDVQQYRIIQNSVNNITIEIKPGRTYTSEQEEFIISAIKKYIGQVVEVEVKLKNEIEPTISGKRRVVISHVPVKL